MVTSIFTPATIVLAIFVQLLIGITYLAWKSQKAGTIPVNWIDIILAFAFTLSMWLFDVTSIQMMGEGIQSTSGLISTPEAQILNSIMWVITGLALLIVSTKWLVFDREVWNVLAARTLFVGVVWFMSFSIWSILAGHATTIFGFGALGVYHAAIPVLVVMPAFLAMRSGEERQ